MKRSVKAGIPPKKIFSKIFLSLALAATVTSVACSCTVDEALTVADSLARIYYAEQLGAASTTQTTEPVATTAEETTAAPAPTSTPTETTAKEEPAYITTFAMPFADAAHGGTDYRVTQDFSSTHGGLDIGVYWGNPILASTDGKVVYAYNDGDLGESDLRWTYGTFVVIESPDGIYRTYYAHMSRRAVSVGDEVKQGDVVGYSGNTGRVSSSSAGKYAGTHLHFEVRVLTGGTFVKRDPKLYLPWWN